jgi:hypothetical protein
MKNFLQKHEPEIVEWLVSLALFTAITCVLVFNYWKLDRAMLVLFGGPPVFRGISTSLSGFGIVHMPTAVLFVAIMAGGLLANPVACMAIDALKRWAIHQRHMQLVQEADDDPVSVLPNDSD